MEIIFSEECQKQLQIINSLKDKNEFFLSLNLRVGICLKELSECSDMDAPVLGKKFHQNKEREGRLGGDLSDVVVRNIDLQHRISYIGKNKDAVILTSIGHYNINKSKKNYLFTPIEGQVPKIKNSTTQNIEKLKLESTDILKNILSLVKDVSVKDVAKKFNAEVDKINICPMTIDCIHKNMSRFFCECNLNNLGKLNIESYFEDEAKKKFIENTVVNTRAFNNVAARIVNKNDLKKTLVTKLNLDMDMFKQFSNIVCYLNKKISQLNLSNSHKQSVLKSFTDSFLLGFDKRHDEAVNVNQIENGEILSQNITTIVMKKFDEYVINSFKSDIKHNITNKSQTLQKIKTRNEMQNYLLPSTNLQFHIIRKKLNLMVNGKSRNEHIKLCEQLGIQTGILNNNAVSKNDLNIHNKKFTKKQQFKR